MNRQSLFSKLGIILRDTEILMREFEQERDQSLDSLQFEGAESVLKDFYKKTLTSVYRMRNNAAALLLRNNCSCNDYKDYVGVSVDGVECKIPKQALKNILQKDYETVINKNINMELATIHLEVDPKTGMEIRSETEKGPKEETDIANKTVRVKQAEAQSAKEKTIPESPKEIVKKSTETLESSFDDFFDNDEYFMDLEPEKDESHSFIAEEEASPAGKPAVDDRGKVHKTKQEEKIVSAKEADDGPVETAVENDDAPAIKDEPVKAEDDDAFWLEDEFFFSDDEPASGKEPVSRKEEEQYDEPKQKDHHEKVEPEEEPEEKPEPIEEDSEIQDDDFGFDFGMDDEWNANPEKEDVKEREAETQEYQRPIEPEETEKGHAQEDDSFFSEKDGKFNDDFFFMDDENENKKVANKENSIETSKKKIKSTIEESKPTRLIQSKTEPEEEIGFSFFDDFDDREENPKNEVKQKEEKKPAAELFRPNVISFETRKVETKEQKESLIKPKFTSGSSDDDPDEIMRKLHEARTEYDKAIVEKKIIEEQTKKDLGGTVFDLSTGGMKRGTVDVEKAAGKIDRVAESLIETSRKDKLLDMKMNTEQENGSYTYQVQKESDYTRNARNFVLDAYKLKISIYDDDENILREDVAKMVVAPITIPATGSSFVTDICAYLESNGEKHGSVVLPGGKTTIAIRCDDYSVFVRGSWEDGKFLSTISIVGNGNHVKHKLSKKELRPDSMDGIGIGHNVIILDHATTVHIIPTVFKNTEYENTDFMGIIAKDYGIDQDAECLISGVDGSIMVKGEKLKYTISCKWDEEKNLLVDQRVNK